MKYNAQAGPAYMFISAFASVTISVVLIAKSKDCFLRLHNCKKNLDNIVYRASHAKTGSVKSNTCICEFEMPIKGRICK